MGGALLRPGNEIESGANAHKRYVRQEALTVIAEELLLGCTQGHEAEIGFRLADCLDAPARILRCRFEPLRRCKHAGNHQTGIAVLEKPRRLAEHLQARPEEI